MTYSCVLATARALRHCKPHRRSASITLSCLLLTGCQSAGKHQVFLLLLAHSACQRGKKKKKKDGSSTIQSNSSANQFINQYQYHKFIPLNPSFNSHIIIMTDGLNSFSLETSVSADTAAFGVSAVKLKTLVVLFIPSVISQQLLHL